MKSKSLKVVKKCFDKPCRSLESTILSMDCVSEEVDKVFVVGMVVDPVDIVVNASIRCFCCKCALFIVVEPLLFDVLKLLLLIWPRLAFVRQPLPNDILFSNDSASRGAV